MATIDPSYSLRDAEAELAKLDAEEQDFHSMLANHDPAYDGELLPEELADLHSAQRARSKRMDALLQHISVLQSSTPGAPIIDDDEEMSEGAPLGNLPAASQETIPSGQPVEDELMHSFTQEATFFDEMATLHSAVFAAAHPSGESAAAARTSSAPGHSVPRSAHDDDHDLA